MDERAKLGLYIMCGHSSLSCEWGFSVVFLKMRKILQFSYHEDFKDLG